MEQKTRKPRKPSSENTNTEETKVPRERRSRERENTARQEGKSPPPRSPKKPKPSSNRNDFLQKFNSNYKLYFGLIGGVFIVLFVGFIFSFVKYNSAVNRVESIEKDYEKTIAKIIKQRDALQVKQDKAEKFEKNLEKLGVLEVVEDIEKVEETLKKRDLELYNLEKEIETRKSAFKTIKGEPIPIIAGQYIFGLDIPTGRYKAVAKEAKGSLELNDAKESNVVKTELGKDTKDSKVQQEYVFSAYNNFVLKTSKNIDLYLIENVTEEKEEEEDDEDKDKK